MNRRFSINPTYHNSLARPAAYLDKLNAALEQPDYDKRFALYKELIKIIYDNEMVIPLYENADISAMDKRVQDLAWTQGHPFLWRPGDAWFSK
jgi:ABC-type transport system substrate-binding protein